MITLVPSAAVCVVANFNETQLTKVQAGDPESNAVGMFLGLVLAGRVESLSPASGAQFALLPPDNATRNFTTVVQRVPVEVVFDPSTALSGQLRPGMSVMVRVTPHAAQ